MKKIICYIDLINIPRYVHRDDDTIGAIIVTPIISECELIAIKDII